VKDAGIRETVVGDPMIDGVVDPVPTWPKLLRPQHCTELFVSTAHVVEPPAAIIVAASVNGTCTGFS
jgi:hypothetical protein